MKILSLNSIKKTISLVSLALILVGCENKSSEDKITTAKPYENQSITIITPNLGGKISDPIIDEAKKFESKTGATIRVLTPSWSDTIEKTKQSLNDDKINFDIYVIISSWGGSLLGQDHIEPIPQWVKDKIDWDDVLPIYKDSILSWNNVNYSLPYDGDCISLYYRKDIFENKTNQENFKKQYGYELQAPKTWDQYKDIAKFFNGWDWDNDGKIEYGIAGSRLKGYGTMLHFFTRAATYVKHPNDKAYYFDTDTMKPRINNPGFVKALEDYIEIMKYAPKEIKKFSPGNVRNSFIQGEVAMVIDWANTGTMAVTEKSSVVKDKVGYASLPDSNIVYNSKTAKWDNIYNSPSSVSGNWTILVNKNSKNKKLAFDFASHMASKEITTKLISQGWTGVNPSRSSHFENIDNLVQSGFSKNSAKEYLDVLQNELKNKNIVMDLRIPGSDRYYSALSKYIDKTINENLSVKEALDIAAKEWDKITDSLGREQQTKLYKESINE